MKGYKYFASSGNSCGNLTNEKNLLSNKLGSTRKTLKWILYDFVHFYNKKYP